LGVAFHWPSVDRASNRVAFRTSGVALRWMDLARDPFGLALHVTQCGTPPFLLGVCPQLGCVPHLASGARGSFVWRVGLFGA
jgi:hypothetical protein